MKESGMFDRQSNSFFRVLPLLGLHGCRAEYSGGYLRREGREAKIKHTAVVRYPQDGNRSERLWSAS